MKLKLTLSTRPICKPTTPPGDGDVDLYVSNKNSADKLYRNEGDGTFSEVGSNAGVYFSGYGLGAAWGDYDGTVSDV